MSYTFEDFERDFTREHLHLLPVEERLRGVSMEDWLNLLPMNELLKRAPVEERLKDVSIEDRFKGVPADDLLKRVPMEERLKDVSIEDRFKGIPRKLIEDYLSKKKSK